ncbi:MAG: hypothetical protein LBU27_02215 [Candidatus Peribacteria bacterium]|nr:hypothetical protein [Candidatus Peribacteria bacterium]
MLKLLVEFDYYSNEYTYFATPEQFEKIKKDIGKMLSINGKPLTPEQGEIGYKNLGTGSGMTEYKFSGNLPQ